ncbi:sigma-70 family RNA polymerase sigma factor [Pelagibius sp. Alg239-R121]|uniref:sigma-70 family RNA polymerase sigma factor n=1 Tax=Pelagibius sp. Alg239-R121 TaxID=2993448 RepID=UPI0024A74BE5|nr:sigma-70 family RNA polymerase sigma factor [Pelagibius sp. Alg239-R121]
MTTVEASLEASRGRLLGLAYRMLGSRADAEDIVQDAYLRVKGRNQRNIRNLEAFLFTTVTRLCLDHLKSARVKREVYVGSWLPEPVIDSGSLSPESAAELADDLSFALLLTLEKLSPQERAAFLLHDVFDTPFAQIALVLEKSEASCRQLAVRARKAVRSAKPGSPAPPGAHKALLSKFAEAVMTGDVSRLQMMLTDDVVTYSDGGGLKVAALNPIFGADKVARYFIGVARKHQMSGVTIEVRLVLINGAPGIVVNIDGTLDQTINIEVVDGLISAFYLVRNPEKLRSADAIIRAGAFSEV